MIKLTVAAVLLILLPLGGLFLVVQGVMNLNTATSVAMEPASGYLVIFDEDNIPVFREMKLELIEENTLSGIDDGWIGSTLEFTSCNQQMNLHMNFPGEVRNVFFDYSNCTVLSSSWSFHNASDRSFGLLRYANPSANESSISIQFDWKILKHLTFDRRWMSIRFFNPYYTDPLSVNPLIRGDIFFPEIKRLIVQITSNLTLDSLLTTPHPSYHHSWDDGRTIARWVFNTKQGSCSIQSVLLSPSLSEEKEHLIQASSLLMASGSSMIAGGGFLLFGLNKFGRLSLCRWSYHDWRDFGDSVITRWREIRVLDDPSHLNAVGKLRKEDVVKSERQCRYCGLYQTRKFNVNKVGELEIARWETVDQPTEPRARDLSL